MDEIKSVVFAVFSGTPGKKRNIYLYNILKKNGISKKMCEMESQVTSTAFYRFRVKHKDEMIESENIIESIITFKNRYGSK